MEWSNEQQRALTAVADWLRDGSQPLFRLFGYAGTGKTTLAKHLAENAGGRVHFAAFTGKAALVLQQKGCPNASTIHSLIYKPVEKSEARLDALEQELKTLKASEEPVDADVIADYEKLIKEERDQLNKATFTINRESELLGAALLVVDECSMVNEEMARDMMSFGVPILVLGDPGQLPPVYGTGFFIKAEPDFMLTEIHRQAKDNPIIHLATQVRLGNRLKPGKYGDSRVLAKRLQTPTLARADQVLVGRNITRHQMNDAIRATLGFKTWYPQQGDKLVCLRNNRDLGWFNGGQFTLHESPKETPTVEQPFHLQVEETRGAMVHPEPFLGEEKKLEELRKWERFAAEEFDYGYAMTVHKSQGSQWDKVVLMDETFCFRDSWEKWLYTGITRAAKLVVVMK